VIHTITEFEHIWTPEMEATQKVLKHITTASMETAASPLHRTLGRIGWHITTSIPEMMARTGLNFPDFNVEAPVPASAKEIFGAYTTVSVRLLEQIKATWSDGSLSEEDDMYGQKWPRAKTLQALVFHQIHHRGQMTVLMRQAGLRVPGLYGPSLEEWSAFGMQPPAV
jgi:uncharacterized damage-inducible protein DinB